MKSRLVLSAGLLAAGHLSVAALLVSARPAASVTLYGLVDDGQVYVSQDGGSAWTGETTLPTSHAVGLVAGPDPGQRTLLTRDGGVWRADGTAGGWMAVGSIAASDLVDLTVTSNGTLLALAASGSIYDSEDGGTSWLASAAVPASDAVSLTVTAAGEVLVLTRRGSVWRSSAGGSFVAVAALTLSDAVAVRARYGTVLLLSDTGWVMRSTDGGEQWETVATLSQVGSAAVCATGQGWAAATETGDVAISPDGIAWSWVGTLSQVGLVGLSSDWSLVTGAPIASGGIAFRLGALYPNPSPSGGTVLLPLRGVADGSVRLEVFDARGRLVERRQLGSVPAGRAELSWATPGLAAGVYHLSLVDDRGRRATGRWVVVD